LKCAENTEHSGRSREGDGQGPNAEPDLSYKEYAAMAVQVTDTAGKQEETVRGDEGVLETDSR